MSIFACCNKKKTPLKHVSFEHSTSKAIEQEASKAYSYASRSIPSIESVRKDSKLDTRLPNPKIIVVAQKAVTVEGLKNMAVEKIKFQDKHDKYEM